MASFTVPPPFVEPTPRRIRVRLGATVVADSERALLLSQFGGKDTLPSYYLPLDDVRPGVLTDERDGRWTVTAGGFTAPDSAWTNDDFPELKGHVTFSWYGALRWFEEDEEVFVHARSPYHRVDTLRSSRRVEIFISGERVAHSVRPLLLFETSLPTRFYLPFEDVRTDLLSASDTITQCPWKGVARYWSHPAVADVAWSYPDPIPENPKIKDLICFFDERVDVVVDGVPRQRPESPFS